MGLILHFLAIDEKYCI